ncbi:MAG: hypothetical protein CG440_1708, partial [Methanosaeta sp. NSM2]
MDSYLKYMFLHEVRQAGLPGLVVLEEGIYLHLEK